MLTIFCRSARIKACLILLLLLRGGLLWCGAQDSTLTLSTTMFRSTLGTTQLMNLSMMKGWVYKPGTNPAWAKPTLNTADWQRLNPSDLSIQQADKTGRAEGWFRLRITLDSTFQGMPLTLESHSWAAAELYVDGQLLATYGNTGSNGKPYREHYPYFASTRLAPLTPEHDNVVAIHLVDYVSPFASKKLKSQTRYGGNKTLLLMKSPQAVADTQFWYHYFPVFTTFWLAVTLVLTLLFWLLSFQQFYERKVIQLLAVWGTMSTLATLGHFSRIVELPFAFETSFYGLGWVFYYLATPFLVLALVRVLGYSPSLLLTSVVIAIGMWGGWLCLYTDSFANGSYANLAQLVVFLYWLIPARNKLTNTLWPIVAGLCLTILFDLTFTVVSSMRPLTWFLFITGSSLSLPFAFLLYITLRFKDILTDVRQKAAAIVEVTEEKRDLLATQNQQLEQQVEARTAQLKASQAQLIQKEKLASLGELTAGIAHEIQNPLNFVNNFSEVSAELMIELTEEVEKGDLDEVKAIAQDVQQNLHKIHQHGERASRIVKGMLEHSRASTGERQLTDVNALVDEYLRLAYQGQRAKDKDFTCELVTDLDPALGQVNLVPQEMGRVLLNLYANAFYAIWERQKQGIDGEYKPKIEVLTKQENDQVVIQVQDNGTGIPEPVKAKIFQPFFTTKPTGEGTGLGLSLSYDIITQGHGGSLTVESKDGEGTEFVIQFPASR